MDGKSAPQPKGKEAAAGGGATAAAQSTNDAFFLFILTLGKFVQYLFKLNLLSYFFWTGFMYLAGATTLLVGFRSLAPTINGVSACPAKQSAFFACAIWFTLACACILTAYGFTTVEQMTAEDFAELTTYVQVVGFLTRMLPTGMRLAHIFTMCQLNVISIQVLFLPECNSKELVYAFGASWLIWWAVLVFGVWVKHQILVPNFVYKPLMPSNTVAGELQTLMRCLGP